MKELSVSETASVYGAGESWDPTSLLVGIASSKLPPQISIPIAITTEIAVQAKPHMPVKVPVPVMIGPSWNGSSFAPFSAPNANGQCPSGSRKTSGGYCSI